MINLYYANAYCSEDISKIENYDKAIADKDQTWVCHHRLEIRDDYRNSVEEHKKHISMYFKGKHWKLVDGKRVWYKEAE